MASSVHNASVIRRSDYTPLAWTVETIDLHFDLHPDATIVRSRMRCVPNHVPGAPDAGSTPLRLWGDELELMSLTVDGKAPKKKALRTLHDGLEIDLAGQAVEVEIQTRINPQANTVLSGLYCSNGGFFTQCEAEGFRRITYFPDRPDVMARYTVTLEADREMCPVLLSNGNLLEEGEKPDGRHYARWEDPFPKPSYLFALVAAKLVALERQITTLSGRTVRLQVWVEEGNLDRAEHAMLSLINAIRWDEETFGLELDLERFMIVAVADFNMGAMENKGLNIFNTKYVLAKPDTATDTDYANIESVVGHEYFHNWTGNRVTCRDWFQLTLKEGLTVFRDQQFSADMLGQMAGPAGAESARAVKRINDVRALRSAQFPEDAGPMAHPIRPDLYEEINNFYTATVYEKGAEVIRMLHTLLGSAGFRKGMDRYFERHDGCAVTCDDFVHAMGEANQRDLGDFMRWYSQVGTPRVDVQGLWENGTYTLTLRQSVPVEKGLQTAQERPPLVIPFAVGMIGPDGQDRPLQLAGETYAGGTTRVLELTEREQRFVFTGLNVEPVPSLLRGFSAPVQLVFNERDDQLAFRMMHDSDPFNRWDAAQSYTERIIFGLVEEIVAGQAGMVPESFVDAVRRVLTEGELDPAFRALLLTLPSEGYLLERMPVALPAALRTAQMRLIRTLGQQLSDEWLTLSIASCSTGMVGPYRYHPVDAGQRALSNLALRYLAAVNHPEGLDIVQTRFNTATNMTDRFGALVALGQSTGAMFDHALAAFHDRHRDDALVLDKWFALQAGGWRWSDKALPVIERVQALMDDEAFNLANPNKVYALLGTFFRGNPAEFHREDGGGYVFWADQVMALDAINPQIASRMARALENWQHYSPELQKLIQPQLERVLTAPALSSDVAEIIGKAMSPV